MYRYIEDGNIIGGPQALPTNWRDKGDISGWTAEALKAEGWLPNVVVDERVAGEVDAGWTDVLEPERVVQTLHSKPAEVAPVVVPEEVTMRQAQLVLLYTPAGNGTMLDAVEAAIAQLAASGTPEGRAAKITWEKSATVRRDNALIGQLKGALGLTDSQIDSLFVAASKL